MRRREDVRNVADTDGKSMKSVWSARQKEQLRNKHAKSLHTLSRHIIRTDVMLVLSAL